MTQATVEAGIISTITQHADFDSDNAKLYDWRIIGKGLARYCVVSYNTHRREELTLRTERRTWSFNIDVFVPWKGEMDELNTRIGTETQKIVDTLAKYPRLNGTANIQRTVMTVSNTPDVMMARRGRYRGRRHQLDVYEIFEPGRLE
jgi:hypothetical protein